MRLPLSRVKIIVVSIVEPTPPENQIRFTCRCASWRAYITLRASADPVRSPLCRLALSPGGVYEVYVFYNSVAPISSI